MVFALFFTLLSVIFSFTLDLMAGPYIVGDLGGSNDISTYTTTFYSLGNALSIPLGAALLDRITIRRYLVGTLLLFAFFTWAAAIAPTFPFLNATRFMQGFVTGPFYALILGKLIPVFVPEKHRSTSTAVTLLVFTIVPALGASWGGPIAYLWNWRVLFYFNLPFILFLAGYFWIKLKDFDTFSEERKSFDGIGYLFYFIGVFCLGVTLIVGQELDWFRSTFIIATTVIGILSLLFFIFWDLQHPNPVLALRLLKNGAFSFVLMNLGVLFFIYFAMVTLLSLWLKLYVNYTPDYIAVLIGSMAVAGIFPWYFIRREYARFDTRIFLIIAIALLILSSYHTMLFNVEIDFFRIAISRITAGFALAMFLPPLFRLCFHICPPHEELHTLSLLQVVRALSSGLGASVFATIWLRRQVFYHERLGSQLTVFSPTTDAYFSDVSKFHVSPLTADAGLEYALQQQATSLALDDCFYLMCWILGGLLITYAFTFFWSRSTFRILKV
jgi:DHA2 family multidrug resistance protein